MDGSNNKVFAFLEKNLMGPMGKIASLKVVRAIMGATAPQAGAARRAARHPP